MPILCTLYWLLAVMTGSVRDPSWITLSVVLSNVEWIPLQIIHSINKQIKFTCQGCDDEMLPSVWPRSEGSNTRWVYCCQLKFTLFLCPLWEHVWSWKVILCGIWQLCFIYFFEPCLFFSSRNSPTSEGVVNGVPWAAPAWQQQMGHLQRSCRAGMCSSQQRWQWFD